MKFLPTLLVSSSLVQSKRWCQVVRQAKLLLKRRRGNLDIEDVRSLNQTDGKMTTDEDTFLQYCWKENETKHATMAKATSNPNLGMDVNH